jgi:hypothetical protein
MPAKVPATSPAGLFDEDSFKYSPLEHLRSLFVGFFQGLFQASPLGAYHWEESDDSTEIYISSEGQVKASIVNARPAISLTRGPVQFYSLGLDDMLDYDFRTGKKKKTVLVPGTMTVNCSSRVPIETENIAWTCAEQLWLHRELLMRAGFFEIGRMPVIGAPSPAGSIVIADEGDEWYVTAVSCPFQFYRTSQFTPLSVPFVREIVMRLRTRTPSIAEQAHTTGRYGGPPGTPTGGLPDEIERLLPPPFAPAASDVYGNTPNPGFGVPTMQRVPNPLNPAQTILIRSSRPNSPAVRPAGMGGRAIPLATDDVTNSSGKQTNAFGQRIRTVKV